MWICATLATLLKIIITLKQARHGLDGGLLGQNGVLKKRDRYEDHQKTSHRFNDMATIAARILVSRQRVVCSKKVTLHWNNE